MTQTIVLSNDINVRIQQMTSDNVAIKFSEEKIAFDFAIIISNETWEDIKAIAKADDEGFKI